MAQTLRDWLGTQQGYKVGNIGATPTVNNIKLNPTAAGLKNINGSWTGTTQQYQNAVQGISPLTKLRDYFNESEIGFRGSTPSIDGTMINPEQYGLQNIGGNWYGQTAQLAQIQDSLKKPEPVQPSQSISDNPYKSPYTEQLQNLTSQLLGGYDPTKDTSLQSAQNQAMEAVKQSMGKTNMLYGSDTAKRMQDEAQKLVPEYEQLNQQRTLNQLQALQGLEQQDMSKYQQGFENVLAESGMTGKYYGGDTLAGRDVLLSEKQQDWNQKFNNKQFNYQAERDKIGDSQFDKQFQLQLDEFAWSKNVNNPTERNKILQNKVLDVELSYLPKEKQAQLGRIYQDMETNKISQEAAKKQLDMLDLEAQQAKANIEGTKANTAATKASTETQKMQNDILKSGGGEGAAYTKDEFNRYDQGLKEQGVIGSGGAVNKPYVINYLDNMLKNGANIDLIIDLGTKYGIKSSEIGKTK